MAYRSPPLVVNAMTNQLDTLAELILPCRALKNFQQGVLD
jgi:hypothetical protein